MKILVASDHGGFELKNKIFNYLKEEGFEAEDMGAAVYDKDDDYPEIMIPVAMRVVSDPENTRAIILGKSGNGEAMLVNRFPGIRAAVYHGGNLEIVRLSREHNDSNVLSLAGGFLSEEEAMEVVKIWISTPFSNEERHVRRNEMMDNIE
ncbi:MAG: RpiB/LacA/LacB family sugar-phosphate isomerase [bacterium]|nr:RpiB/LacA/LacB family sugar-phosphate isomerase [bacterium]